MAMRSLLLRMVDLLERAAKRLGGGGSRQLGPFAEKEKLMSEKGKKKSRVVKGIGKWKKTEAEEVGEEEVWRRTIMMGEKCQPLEFSGVIYYDGNGRRVADVPRSPFRSKIPDASTYF
ncbi:hypothetical protein HPP92_024403 [Vanilla planifolia]|uniref:Uncharacterized protein n=1 Tax=Vanilla planifolia TaxID=51239 RepID=A0A835PQ85_VANPL|nr:hypothetical protein HPP92_024403 [Vanilla planifolia]